MSSEHSILVILSNAAKGSDDAYNAWYTGQHLDEVVALPGVRSARRFEYTGISTIPYPDEEDPHPSRQYLAIYELEGDPATAVEGIREARASGDLVRPGDIVDISAWVFRAISPLVTSSSADQPPRTA
jgi:hypothetical protein